MSEVSANSPAPKSLRKIGKISGVHGLKGELYISVFSKDVSWIHEVKELVLEDLKGQRQTRLVNSLRPFKDGFLVFIEGVKDRTQAELFRHQLVFVDGDIFTTEDDDETFYLAEIEGFMVFDKEVKLGAITGFGTNTVQDLLVVEVPAGFVEIPLVEDFLMEIDFEKGEVHMDLPPGLIEAQVDVKK